MPKGDIPVEQALALRNKGLSNDQIIQNLQRQGYDYQQISEALNQLEIKEGVEEDYVSNISAQAPAPSSSESKMQPSAISPSIEEFPQPQTPQIPLSTPMAQSYRGSEEQIEEIAESIIEEKWNRVVENIGDLTLFKEKMATDITSIKQEILRLETRFENLQKSMLGKVTEYSQGVLDIGQEMKALERVLQKILSPLTTNVKELDRITKKLKK